MELVGCAAPDAAGVSDNRAELQGEAGAHLVEAGARIGDATVVGPGCVIGRDAEIGSDCLILSRVVVSAGPPPDGEIKSAAALAILLAIIGAVVMVTEGTRKIPVQYAKRVVGRRVYGGQSTYLPLRLNTGGVIPVIFAASIMSFPQTLGQMIENRWLQKITEALAWGEPLYNLIYFLSIIFFCYFYTSIIFNPEDTAENMRKYGGFIPGIRPGKRTAEFIDKILTRITLVGAVYLALVAILPEILIAGFKVATIPVIGPGLDAVLPTWFTQGLGIKFYFGGTSLLIVVGVAMDTVQQIESQLVMRHYDGFMRRGRIKGRR